jgi:Na+/proline symporter
MPPWVALAIYAAGFVITSRRCFVTDDSEDRGDARLTSVGIGLIWPLLLAFFAVCGLLALPTLGAKTGRERAVLAEEKRQRLAARTAELEAENDRLRKAVGES